MSELVSTQLFSLCFNLCKVLWGLCFHFLNPRRSKWKRLRAAWKMFKKQSCEHAFVLLGNEVLPQPTFLRGQLWCLRDERKINMYGNLVWCPWDCGGRYAACHHCVIKEVALLQLKASLYQHSHWRKGMMVLTVEADISISLPLSLRLASKIPPHPPCPPPIIITPVSGIQQRNGLQGWRT